GVHLDLTDDDGFNYTCRQGRELGFDGKTLIHPKTIEIANDIFSPSNEEITWSKKIIQAHEEASARGEGVVIVDGKLIESLHVEGARRTLLLDDAIKQLH
ncbi:MAG: CoA ester lyase, partial [Gammaproteobacteria bacterium]|nr:CoA ester lyase [Gammaproteobacteria bacterium]